MRGNTAMIKDQEGEERQQLEINRGFELMLRNSSRKKKTTTPNKTFQIRFGKLFCLFKREITFEFDISLNFRKI